MLYAAGVTFYLGLALLPLLLVTVRLAALIVGPRTLDGLGGSLAGLLPDNLGARAGVDSLLRAGSRLPWTALLAALLPASFYGEGLRRAFDRFARRTGSAVAGPVWRGRLLLLVSFGGSPLLLLAALTAASRISWALGTGTGPRLLGIYLAFLTTWVELTLLLVFAYRAIAPTRPGIRALLWGAASTGSFLAGMLLGFLLFLRVPLNLGTAYGGFWRVGWAAAVGGWLLALHVVVLTGYVLTLRLDARGGHPWGRPRTAVAAAAA